MSAKHLITPKSSKKSRRLTGILVVAGIILIGVGIIPKGETDKAEDPGQTETQITESAQAYDYEITDIEAFFQEYEDNAVAADKKYNGKYIKVTGCFKDSGKDVLNNYYITLGGANDITWDYFQCYFKNDEALDKVLNYKTGDSLTLIGKVGDQNLSVSLKDCTLAE